MSSENKQIKGSVLIWAISIAAPLLLAIFFASLGGLSSSMGMRTVSAASARSPTERMLSEAGFDYAQGHSICKPKDLGELIAAKSCADLILDPETASFARLLQTKDVISVPDPSYDSKYLH